MLEDFEKAEDRECYTCHKEVPFDDLKKGGPALVQSFTGRVFCNSDCGDEYLESEGLS